MLTEALIAIGIVFVFYLLDEYGSVIFTVLGLALAGFLIYKISVKVERHQAEQREHEENMRAVRQRAEEQRLAEVNLDKELIVSSMKSIFSATINPASLSEAKHLIEDRKGISYQYATTVSEDFVKSEAKKYSEQINLELETALEKRDFESATAFVDFLIYIGSATPAQKQIIDKLAELEYFADSNIPSILSMRSRYGEPDEHYIKRIENDSRFENHNAMLASKLDISDLLWGISLHRPIDYYHQGVILKELWSLKKNGLVCVEAMSSALVFRGFFKSDLLEVFIPTFHHDLMVMVQQADKGTAISLASVACFADNTEDELFILSELKKRNELPESMRERFQMLHT